MHRPIVVILCVVALAGCASNIEQAAKLLAERPIQTCTTADGTQYSGTDCSRLVDAEVQARKLRACADYSEQGETLCVLAVALDGRSGGDDGGQTAADVQMLIAAMNNDTRIKAAWIGNIPVLGNLAATAYQVHQSEKTLRTAFENGGTRIGSLNVTKSDDGGGVVAEGEAFPGEGGGGDQTVIIGNRNQSLYRSDGSNIVNDRNANLIGTGQPDSSLDPSFVNNQNATAPDNPINNAPITETNDNDGSNNSSALSPF